MARTALVALLFILPLLAPPASAGDRAGAVAGRVAVETDGKARRDRSGVVVMVEDVPDSEPEPGSYTIRQKGKQFDPDVLVVPEGSTVSFPNNDKIHHNVFSVSRTKRFDLGLYKSGESKGVKFGRAGVVDVYCNIHPNMAAKIKVVDTRFYAVTGKDGSFRIDRLPPGTYPIVAWQPYGEEFRGTVEIKPGETARVKIELDAGEKPRRHLRKDGTPYGRYE